MFLQGVEFQDDFTKSFWNILVCPLCKKPLAQKETGESLSAVNAIGFIRVRDNIPILLID